MANVTENQFNETIPPAGVKAIEGAIVTIKSSLPKGGAFTLTEEQMAHMQSIDVDNRVFAQEVIAEMGISGATVLPAYLVAALLQNDLTLADQAETIESGLKSALEAVQAVNRQAAAELMANANMVYRIYEIAAKSGIPGAQASYEKLKVRFEGQGGGAPVDPTP